MKKLTVKTKDLTLELLSYVLFENYGTSRSPTFVAPLTNSGRREIISDYKASIRSRLPGLNFKMGVIARSLSKSVACTRVPNEDGGETIGLFDKRGILVRHIEINPEGVSCLHPVRVAALVQSVIDAHHNEYAESGSWLAGLAEVT